MEKNIKNELASLDLGRQIRDHRKQRNLTLQELSDLTGLSKPNLSQIENNIVTPPIATLLKISTALGITIGTFFKNDEQAESIVVVRKADRHGIAKGPHVSHIGYQYEPLAYPRSEKKMEPFIVHVEERKSSDIVYNNHIGEEFLFILEGEVEFRSGANVIILKEGDSLYFDAGIPHGYRGLNGRAKGLVVIYKSTS